MTSLLTAVRFSARLLLKRPGEAAIAVLALGVGIGLTTTMFCVVHGIYLRTLPFEDAKQLIQLDCSNLAAGVGRMPVRYADYLYWREQQTSFEDLAAWYGTSIVISATAGPAEHHNGAHVSSNLFSLLRVRPALGRSFDASDESPTGEAVAIISARVWRNRFGRDPGVLGKAIRINGEMMTIIGVMPEGFHFPLSQDCWLPLRLDRNRGGGSRIGLQAFGRLKDDVSLDQARAEIEGIAGQLAAEFPATNQGVGAVARPYVDAYTDPEMRAYLNIMLAAVFGVLVVACANVTNLLLCRAALRTRELAVRRLLGAGRGRLILQLLIDALLIAGSGGILGLMMAYFGAGMIHQAVEPFLRSFWIDIRVDSRVLGFVVGITLVASVVAGIVPAIRASGCNVNEILKAQSRTHSDFRSGRFSKALVVAQIALSCGLLVPTALMLKSVVKIKNIDHGFETDHLLFAGLTLPSFDYPDGQSWTRFFDALMRRLEAIPEARRVAFANALPNEPGAPVKFCIEGATYPSAGDYPRTQWVVASPQLFAIFNISVVAGRTFRSSADQVSEPVVVVNRSFAERYFGGKNPLGRRIRLGGAESSEPWLTIIGVVMDSSKSQLPKRQRGFLPLFSNGEQDNVTETVFLAAKQNPTRSRAILIRTEGTPLGLASRVRQEIAAVDPEVPTLRITSMAARIANATWDYRLFSTVFSVFGVVALLMAMIGLYAVMGLSVRRRTHELGVRMAVGAQATDVLKLVMSDGLRQVALGMVVGLALAAALARVLTALLFQVEPWDFTVFVCVAAVLGLSALGACLVPARWAAGVSPMVAIRDE